MIPWERIREQYETEQGTRQELAERFGVAYSTLCRRAARENWQRRGQRETLRTAVRQLAGTAVRLARDAREEPDVRTVKDLSAVLRELTALGRALEQEEERGETVRVVLAEEVEPWSE